ncbi:MAG: hypothetical protein WA373_03325 [Burkholderiales bacterium]
MTTFAQRAFSLAMNAPSAAGAHLGALFREELLHFGGVQDPGQLGVQLGHDLARRARGRAALT